MSVAALAPTDVGPSTTDAATATAITWSACPACGAGAREDYVRFDTLVFSRCGDCGSVYKSYEHASLQSEALYEGAYHVRKRGRRWAHRVRKAARQILGASQFGEVRRYLDIGCSVGFMLEAGERLGLQSAGTDISKDAVEAARARGLSAKVGTLEALPFEERAFDLVSMRHVLEHTPRPDVALAELKRVLDARGLALIAVPDVSYWKGDKQRKTYRYYRPNDLGQQHYVYYSEDSLARMLERHGFEVRSRSKAFFRAKLARKSPVHWAWEHLRHGALSVWCGLGRALRLRRELWFIVQKR